jgi:hypothetical protein
MAVIFLKKENDSHSYIIISKGSLWHFAGFRRKKPGLMALTLCSETCFLVLTRHKVWPSVKQVPIQGTASLKATWCVPHSNPADTSCKGICPVVLPWDPYLLPA